MFDLKAAAAEKYRDLSRPERRADVIRYLVVGALLVILLTMVLSRIQWSPSLAGDTSERWTPMAPITAPPPVGPAGDWDLVFSDEFVDDSLDSARWSTCYPHGTVGCTNKGNNELEWYTPDGVSVNDGVLRLTAREQAIVGEDGEAYDYTSGMVTTGPEATSPGTKAKFGFKYGYVESRVKVPSGQGLWPAVWLLPVDGQWPPEIDILEVLGHDTTTLHRALHWEEQGEFKKDVKSSSVNDLSEGFHTIGAEWSANAIHWYLDGELLGSYTEADEIPDEHMYALVNLAVGGNWPGSPDESTEFPATYEIDWVRIWQRPA